DAGIGTGGSASPSGDTRGHAARKRSCPAAKRLSLGRRRGDANAGGVEGVPDALGHLVDRAESVDLDEQPLVTEHLEHGGRLATVDLLAVPDGVLRVIRAALLDGALGEPPNDLVLVGLQ